MPGSLESGDEKEVRDHFENAVIFLGLCESILSPLKSAHMVDTKKRKGAFFLHLRCFPYSNNKIFFPLILIFSCSRWFEDQSHTMCNR